MLIICPKCQFENNAETTHVICTRCATLIEVNVPQLNGAASPWETPDPAQRLTRPMADMPFTSSGLSAAPRRDPYATRLEPEAEEVLDIPRLGNGAYSGPDPGITFDEVLSPGQSGNAQTAPPARLTADSYPELPLPEQIDAFPGDLANHYNPVAPIMPPVFIPPPVPGFATSEPVQPAQIAFPDFSGSNGMMTTENSGWPVLPDNSFSKRSSLEAPLFSAEPQRPSLLRRMLLVGLVFAGLAAIAWYVVGDKLFRKSEPLTAGPVKSAAQPEKGTGAGGNANTGTATSATANNSAAPGKTGAAATAPAATKNTSPETGKDGNKTMTPPSGGAAVSGTDAGKKTEVTPPPVVASGHSVNRAEGGLTVQIGSFSGSNEATQRVDSLKSAGIEARVVKADIPGKGTWYRVQSGRFTSREEASRWAAQQKARGVIREFMVTGFQSN